MRKMHLRGFAVAIIAALFFISGCGYTTASLLPSNFKTIYVDNLVNKIRVADESTDSRMFRGYRPGMEIDATRAIRDRYLRDGNLKVTTNPDDADLILKGDLVDFRNEALRYDRNDNIEEYRIRMVVNIELLEKNGKTRWTENNFAGESLYRTSGPLARSETAAITEANEDLARRIVERTIEEW